MTTINQYTKFNTKHHKFLTDFIVALPKDKSFVPIRELKDRRSDSIITEYFIFIENERLYLYVENEKNLS